MKQIVIRVDANGNIGMGHMMRTLSLADAFSRSGHHVFFLLSDDTASAVITERGYEAIVLQTDYRFMEEELDCWPEISADYLIIDSYYVTNAYLEVLRQKMHTIGGKLIYFDDVCAFPYPVDILINYNAYADGDEYHLLYSGSDVKEPRKILGPSFAPLRLRFRGIERRDQHEQVDRVLISTGGSDELHLALTILQHMCSSETDSDGREYHFLLGAMNRDKDEIRLLAAGRKEIVLHENVSDMKSLISGVDICISAAGSTLYEICACGVPLITYCLADNQMPGAEAFSRLGLAINVGDLRDPESVDLEQVMSGRLDPSSIERVFTAIRRLAGDYDLRVEMGTKMQELIDGCGADRMEREILSDDNG